jgi:hypothetical protein
MAQIKILFPRFSEKADKNHTKSSVRLFPLDNSTMDVPDKKLYRQKQEYLTEFSISSAR